VKRGFLYIVLPLLIIGCNATPDLEVMLHECAPMPSPRASATTFVVNGEAYIFAGRDSMRTIYNDLWRYNPETDSWTSLGETPLSPRVNATACTKGDKVYIGLGFNGNFFIKDSYLRDWWCYDPGTNEWTRLADYPNANTDCATAFVSANELYVGYGYSAGYVRDMFRYSISTDTWDSIDVHVSYHGYPTRSFGGTGCTCQNRHFMGSGYYGASLDWWAEFVDGTHWEKRTAIPGKTRTLAASAATDNYVYVTGGMHYGGVNTTGDVLRDIRRYDPNHDSWTFVTVLPKGIYNHCCFTIGKRVFVGMGETIDEKFNNTIYWFEE